MGQFSRKLSHILAVMIEACSIALSHAQSEIHKGVGYTKIASVMQLFVVASVVLGVAFGTPLDDYVNKYDPTYRYEETNITFRGDGYTSYYINMTSQTWLSGKLAGSTHLQ